MKDVEIVDLNEASLRQVDLCGLKNLKHEGRQQKTDWLKHRFPEGLRYRSLLPLGEDRPAELTFIEYAPGEVAWRAVDAPGYMVIHCVMVDRKHQGKGYGSRLVQSCLQDAEEQGMRGVAVVTSAGTWMAGNEVFVQNGFEVVDQAPPSFELLTRWTGDGPLPRFPSDWDERLRACGPELCIISSGQCPQAAKSVRDVAAAARELGVDTRVTELETAAEAQKAPSAFGVFSIVYRGKLLAYHPISRTRFLSIMRDLPPQR